MNKLRYLIVGGSAAGVACANLIKERQPSADLLVITDESDMPYFRPLIPYVLIGKKTANDISMLGNGPYRQSVIKAETSTRCVSVNPKDKTIVTDKGDYISYDKLLIATGSRPFIPQDIEGLESKGVFALRRLSDARAMQEILPKTKRAVLLGGGLVNLKTAFALLERGIKVTLVVKSLEILSQLMEPEDAFILKEALIASGLEVLTGRSAKRVNTKNGSVQSVSLDDGSEIGCEMVCIGKGVRPNVEFLKDSSILIENGVVVDRFTETNIKDIFSAGDVAVTFNPITGQRVSTALWTNAVEMGRCAGLNMIGQKTQYAGTFGVMNATQLAGIPFVSMGIVHTQGTDYEVYRYHSKGAYRKLVFSPDGSKLVGVLLIGDITNAGLYRYLIRENKTIQTMKDLIIHHRLNYGHLLK